MDTSFDRKKEMKIETISINQKFGEIDLIFFENSFNKMDHSTKTTS